MFILFLSLYILEIVFTSWRFVYVTSMYKVIHRNKKKTVFIQVLKYVTCVLF